MPVLPKSNYIGPGNKFPNGEPQTVSDFGGKIHDFMYHVYEKAAASGDYTQQQLDDYIQTADDIYKSDALNNIAEYLTGNSGTIVDFVQSLIGYFGIAGKNMLERFTGQLYPQRAGKHKYNVT